MDYYCDVRLKYTKTKSKYSHFKSNPPQKNLMNVNIKNYLTNIST